jgi:hypothetical protein
MALLSPQFPVSPTHVSEFASTPRAVAGLTVAAISAALASGAPEVLFPPGIYDITGPIVSSTPNQVLTFQVGAVLRFAASGLGKLVISGANAAIAGTPVARFDAASAVAYVAVDLQGQGSRASGFRFEVNANVSNATLCRLSGDFSEIGDITIVGVGEFAIGREFAHVDDTEVSSTRGGRVYWYQIDDGSTTRHYGTVVRLKSRGGYCGGVACNTGGRCLIDQVYDHAGHLNQISNPQVYAVKASWGLRIRDGSEFLEIFGGMFHQSSDGNALSGSQGIEAGEGQLKLYGTKVIGWDIGIRFSGSSDSCSFNGVATANNKTANLQVDSGAWPISGLGLYGCYFENEAVHACINIHLKTGSVPGLKISGGQQAWGGVDEGAADVSILCEPGFLGTDCQLDGVRFQAGKSTDAVTQPNTNSRFFFGYNSHYASNNISKGTYAAKATSIDNLVNTTLRTNTLQANTSLVVGATGDLNKGTWFNYYTANFGAGIPANSSVELDYAWDKVVALNYMLTAGVVGALGGNTGLTFTACLKYVGYATLRATNNTSSAIGAISGTVFFELKKLV